MEKCRRRRTMRQKGSEAGVRERSLEAALRKAEQGPSRAFGRDVQCKVCLLLLGLARVDAKIAIAQLMPQHVVHELLLR